MSPPCLTNSPTEQNISLIILVNNGCCEVRYSMIIAHVKFIMRILEVGMEQKLSSCSFFFSLFLLYFFYHCLHMFESNRKDFDISIKAMCLLFCRFLWDYDICVFIDIHTDLIKHLVYTNVKIDPQLHLLTKSNRTVIPVRCTTALERR